MSTPGSSNSTSAVPSVPSGKVACLLCGGFISVSGGDRARFIDHMSNEHDAKTDCHDVLLAVCVLNTKERGYIVKSSGPRLEEIGRGQEPNFANTFLNKLGSVVGPTPLNTPQPRLPATQQYRRGVPRHRGQGRRQPVHSQPPTRPTSAPVNVPAVLQGNGSISISKVDMSRKCNMCDHKFPSPSALVEHMNRNHFKSLGGINIVSKADNEAHKLEYQDLSVQSPSAYAVPSATTMMRNSQQQRPQRPIAANIQRVPNNIPARVISNVQKMTKPQSQFQANQGLKFRQPELVKCMVCAKTVEKAKYSVHKLSHAQERKNEKVNSIRTTQKNKTDIIAKFEKKHVALSEEVELVDLDNDDIEKNDENRTAVKKISNASLPHDIFQQSDKMSIGDIQCKICDKQLASNMALKMHNNLKHPVKKEVNTEMLLEEEEKDKARESRIKNEVDKLETLELLDNLVNFLNDA